MIPSNLFDKKIQEMIQNLDNSEIQRELGKINNKCKEHFLKSLTLETFVTAALEGTMPSENCTFHEIPLLNSNVEGTWIGNDGEEISLTTPPGFSLLGHSRYEFHTSHDLQGIPTSIVYSCIQRTLQLGPYLFLSYGPDLFEEQVLLEESLQEHEFFSRFSQYALQKTNERLNTISQSHDHLTHMAIQAKEHRETEGIGYWIKYGIERFGWEAFSCVLFNSSYSSRVKTQIWGLVEEVLAYDLIAGYFKGEQRFIEEYLQENKLIGEARNYGEQIKDHAVTFVQTYSQLRTYALKELSCGVLFAPPHFFAQNLPAKEYKTRISIPEFLLRTKNKK